jgi:uncharacterized protein YkwD
LLPTAVTLEPTRYFRTLEHMSPRSRDVIGLLCGGLWLAACNGIIGADDITIADDDEGAGSGGSTSATAPTSGSGGSDGAGGDASGPTTGNGGAGPGSGAGGMSAGPTTTSGPSSSSVTSSSSGGNGCLGGDPALDSEEQAFLVLINNYRAQNSLGPLTACTSLNRAAQGHSDDMRDQNYFSHTGLDNSTPWDRACDGCYMQGCGPSTAMAENIAAGNSGAQGTFSQWQNSPGHNANMLGANFTMIGIGRATGGGMYGVYWTNVFGGNTEPSCN